jgi:hypothetical protein
MFTPVFSFLFLIFTAASGSTNPTHCDYSLNLDEFVFSKDEINYHLSNTREQLTSNRGFVTNRGFAEYNRLLGLEPEIASLDQTLQNLPKNSYWIDAGAGYGAAFKTVFSDPRFNHISQMLGLSFAAPMGLNIHALQTESNGRIKYLETGYLENHIESEFLSEQIRPFQNKADLITDIFGPISYTSDLDKVLNIYFKLLKKNAKLRFLYTVTEGAPKDIDTDKIFDHRLNLISGSQNSVKFLFDQVRGIKHQILIKDQIKTTYKTTTVFLIEIQKISDVVIVPQIETVNFVAGTPPYRFFKVHSLTP